MVVLGIPVLLLSALPIIHSLQIPIPTDLEEPESITSTPDEAEVNIIQDNSVHDDLLHCQLELADKSLGLAALHAQAKILDKDLKQCESDLQNCKADLTGSGVDLSAANAALHTCRSQGSDCKLLTAETDKCLADARKHLTECRHTGISMRKHRYITLCAIIPNMVLTKTVQAIALRAIY
jgi:hypothetical protein